MAEMRASPVKSKALKSLADIVRLVEERGQMEILPFNPATLFPVSSTTLENLAYGNLPMAIPSQSNIPITKTGRKQEVAELAGLLPTLPAASRGAKMIADTAGDAMVRFITGNPRATAMGVLDEAGQLVPMANIAKLKGIPINELLFPGRAIKELSSPEKSALTRFEKSLANRAVRQREELRLGGGDVVVDTPGLIKIQQVGINPESMVDKINVPVAGDLSVAGGTVNQIAGIPLRKAVQRQGGGEYMLLEPNVRQGAAWASEPSAASSKTENLRKFTDQGEDVLGVFLGMSPQGINFSHHMAEGMVGQLPALPITKQAYRELRDDVRNTWIKDPETGNRRYPFQDFPGVDSPEIYDLMAKDGQLRKAIVESMSKAKFRDQGFPRWEDTANVMNDPRLFQGEAGRYMFSAQPGGSVLTPEFKHGSYSAGIPGQYFGGLRSASGEIVGVPADLMFPKTYARMRAMGKTDANIARSMQVAHHGEKFTEEALDPLMKFLGY